MWWWFCKFDSDGICLFENANLTTGFRIMPHWNMKNLGEKYRVSWWEIHINQTVTNTKSVCEESESNSTEKRRDVGFRQKYPGNYTLQCKWKHKCANTNTQIQSRKYKYRHKYKYAVTMAIPRSFRKLNSDGFWLWRNANPTRRSEVRTVWIFSSAVPVRGWRLLRPAQQMKNWKILIFWSNSNLYVRLGEVTLG